MDSAQWLLANEPLQPLDTEGEFAEGDSVRVDTGDALLTFERVGRAEPAAA